MLLVCSRQAGYNCVFFYLFQQLPEERSGGPLRHLSIRGGVGTSQNQRCATSLLLLHGVEQQCKNLLRRNCIHKSSEEM